MNPVRQLVASIAFAALLTTGSAQTFEVEPNNTTGQATLVLSGLSISGQLFPSTDVDIFSYTAVQAGSLTLDLVGDSTNKGEYNVLFSNSSGTVIASYSDLVVYPRNLSTGEYRPLSQAVSVPAPGQYFIRVAAANSFYSSDKQYRLTATFAPITPTITAQPADQNAIAGSTATLSVTANGIPPLSYQWRKNNSPIPGATSSSLRFLSTSDKDAGSYSVAITNTGGTAVSNSAVLTVLPASNPARLINLSVLTPILSGQPLTAGFVLSGSESKRVLIRAIGPTLSTFGVLNPVSDPTLLLYDSRGVIIGSNDDWQSSNASTMASAGAFALPAGSRDAVIVVTLVPGAYTTAARGFGNASGMVLIEVYEAP